MSEASPFLRVCCNSHVGALHLRCSFELRHRWTVLFGASGSGKSSILRVIAGLWRPAGCTVELHGRSLGGLPAHRREVGLVAQQPSLFPHLNVAENAGFGVSGSARADRVGQMLDYLRIGHLRRARVGTLSGGESQRVAIARALLSEPALLLLDESFTGMHEDLRADLVGLLQRQSLVPAPRVLSVTHSVAEAFASAEEVLRIEDGALVAQGPCEAVLAEPRERLLAQLQGKAAPPRS